MLNKFFHKFLCILGIRNFNLVGHLSDIENVHRERLYCKLITEIDKDEKRRLIEGWKIFEEYWGEWKKITTNNQ
jgi:hypothetical protein